jgi:hypothetical protein
MESTITHDIINQAYIKLNYVIVQSRVEPLSINIVLSPRKESFLASKFSNGVTLQDIFIKLPSLHKNAETATGGTFTAHSIIRNLTLQPKVDTKFFQTVFFSSHILSDDLRDQKNKCNK